MAFHLDTDFAVYALSSAANADGCLRPLNPTTPSK